jgi:hypothetical protein
MTFRPLGGEVAAYVPSLDTAGQLTTTLNDLAGANTGTLTDMTPLDDWVIDDGKYALRFTSTNGLVVVPDSNSLDITEELTLACWFKRQGNANHTIISKNVPGVSDGNYYLTIFTNNNLPFFGFRVGATNQRFRCDTATGLDVWTHIAVAVKFGDTTTDIQWYLNGEPKSGTWISGTGTTGKPSANTEALRIGQADATANRSIGLLDDARIFARQLPVGDVELLASERGFVPTGNAIDRRKRLLRMRGYR